MYSLSARLKIPRPFDQWHCSDEVQMELNVFFASEIKIAIRKLKFSCRYVSCKPLNDEKNVKNWLALRASEMKQKRK